MTYRQRAASIPRVVSAPDQTLAKTLRQVRRLRHETQEGLAHKAGLTVAAYARIERGTANPTWTTVCRLARALGTSVSDIARLVEEES